MRPLLFVSYLLAVLPLLFSSEIKTNHKNLQISSEEAIFDGKDFTLKGNITLNHEMGSLKAQMGKSPHPSLSPITFYENVELILDNGFSLKSQKASIDHKTLTILFEGSPVVCSYQYQNKPLHLTGKKILVSCSSSTSLKSLSMSHIQKMEFFDDCCVRYDNKRTLKSPYFSLYKDTVDNSYVLLAKSTNEKNCELGFEKNHINCDYIIANITHQVFELFSPKGVFLVPFQSQEKHISFEAKKMEIDFIQKKFSFIENIKIEDPNIASLATDSLTISLTDKLLPKQVITHGKNKIFFHNNRSSLRCDGSLILDLEAKTVSTESDDDSFVYFQNPEVTVSAKKGFFAYELSKRTIVPKDVELSGNIRFIINAIEKAKGYGIADRFSYLPKEKKLMLIPEENKKVLFWTDDEMIQLSANEIHILESPTTGEKIVEGKGDMRFTFTFAEQQSLINNFKEKLVK